MSMFKKIKNQLSTRFYSKNKESEEWSGTICPKFKKLLDKNAEMANNCQALPSGKGIFTVLGLRGEYKVDINKYTCSCKAWQLTGIPCRHGMSSEVQESNLRVLSHHALVLQLSSKYMVKLFCLAETQESGKR